jgi:uncharacterized membrane-anchored protein
MGDIMRSDPRRDFIWHELHARPYVRFSSPAHVFHFAFLTGEGTESDDHASLERVKESLRLHATYETARHAIYTAARSDVGHLVMSWERHTEFVTYTFFLYELAIPFRPFDIDAGKILPQGFPDFIGVPALVATCVTIGPRSTMPDTPDAMMDLFEGHTVNGSQVMDSRAEAWSAYRVHEDGFGRIALVVDQITPHSLGRTVERLLAIENFHHLGLLSLPLAREIKSDLARWESAVVGQMEALQVAASLEQKRAVLSSFLALAADVENLRARVAGRFAASSAYFTLLEDRFSELRETKIEHVLRLSRFVMRRLAPAAQTCRTVLGRLNDLSHRIDRAAQLLRTSINLHVDEQNQRLLASADRRARLQLELQAAVETLSIVAITYYVLALTGYVLKAASNLGVKLDADLTLGVAAPILLMLAWGVMRLVRKRIREASGFLMSEVEQVS